MRKECIEFDDLTNTIVLKTDEEKLQCDELESQERMGTLLHAGNVVGWGAYTQNAQTRHFLTRSMGDTVVSMKGRGFNMS